MSAFDDPEKIGLAATLLIANNYIREKSNEPYYLALGKFIEAFSLIETQLQLVIWSFAGLKERLAPALLPTIRPAAAIDTINRMVAIKKWPKAKKSNLKWALEQLAVINGTRNDLIHFGAQQNVFIPEEWIVTNAKFSHDPAKIRTRFISKKSLDHMREDLGTISVHLTLLFLWKKLPPVVRDAMSPQWGAPWQYKPALLSPSPHKNPARTRKRSSQLQSVRKKAATKGRQT